MISPEAARERRRLRAAGYFIIAAVYFFFAQAVSQSLAKHLSGAWPELAGRSFLLILLLAGYGFMGRAFNNQAHPFAAMGLELRPGWKLEFGKGAALGWGMLTATILPMVLMGGYMVGFQSGWHAYGLLLFNLVVLGVASLAEEVAFRGYPFQRLIDAVGPVLATLLLSAVFGVAHMLNPDSSTISVIVTMVCGWFLSIAYLRTRALWLPWGWHFAWNCSMGLLFGLPISGLDRFSPVIQASTIGHSWLTGSFYGPEGSVIAMIVILIGILVLLWVTRELAAKYAWFPADAGPHTVQILPASGPLKQAPDTAIRQEAPQSTASTPLPEKPEMRDSSSAGPAAGSMPQSSAGAEIAISKTEERGTASQKVENGQPCNEPEEAQPGGSE